MPRKPVDRGKVVGAIGAKGARQRVPRPGEGKYPPYESANGPCPKCGTPAVMVTEKGLAFFRTRTYVAATEEPKEPERVKHRCDHCTFETFTLPKDASPSEDSPYAEPPRAG